MGPNRNHERDFILGKLIQLPPDYANLSYFLARYHIEQYCQTLFDSYAIEMPAELSHSVRKRQAEFLAGRICARAILDMHDHTGYTVGTGKHREPCWPKGVIGSITHSNQYAAAAACADTDAIGVGIDIETVIGLDLLNDISALVLSTDELGYLQSLEHAMDIARLVTLSFSAKESFFKAAFANVQDYFGFDAVELVEVDLKRHRLRLRCRHSLCRVLQKDSVHEVYFEYLDDMSLFTAAILKTDRSRTSEYVG